VLFNYIFSNGDAHVKNFSAMQTEAGDYVLTPAYDLLCTRIHSPKESDMALMLLKDRFTGTFEAHGFYTLHDFQEFGNVLGIKESRLEKILNEFKGKEESIDYLVDRSFLNHEIKADFKSYYKDKLKRINAVKRDR
jgi:serine/threonine-protein kinase HipA